MPSAVAAAFLERSGVAGAGLDAGFGGFAEVSCSEPAGRRCLADLWTSSPGMVERVALRLLCSGGTGRGSLDAGPVGRRQVAPGLAGHGRGRAVELRADCWGAGDFARPQHGVRELRIAKLF